MHRLARLDRKYIWHPFTQMRDWFKREPITIVAGEGAELRDLNGRRYLDANSSIWTNLHGHNHPAINTALRQQLAKIAHSSALGLASEPASLLAEKLVAVANGRNPARPARRLEKVFFSDDGSTAVEVALKLAYEFARRRGNVKRPKFLSLAGAYHGDTIGAVALGHVDLFHKAYAGLLFKTDQVMSPYCYRCPFNRAKPERADARQYRKCNWECVGKVEQKFAAQKKRGQTYAGFVFEPLMQGAAGMIPQPPGWLRQVAGIARNHGALLIADEVMTGFGRTGTAATTADNLSPSKSRTIFAPNLFGCHHEGVQPDLLCLAKGMTGGYLPMAVTLAKRRIFDAFLGEYEEFKTFFHGHSYTANQLGAAASLASLKLLQSAGSIRSRIRLEKDLRQELPALWSLKNVGDVRQVGLIAGIELVRDWKTRETFDLRERAGIRVCEAMARRGVVTRPIGNVIVLMPPYCTTSAQLHRMVKTLYDACRETFG